MGDIQENVMRGVADFRNFILNIETALATMHHFCAGSSFSAQVIHLTMRFGRSGKGCLGE